MPQGPGDELHSGEVYTLLERIAFVFTPRIRGVNEQGIHEINKKILGRKDEESDKCWMRLCRNATAYENKDEWIYDITPISGSKQFPTHLNKYAKQYITYQMFINEKKSNPKRLSREMGIPIEPIVKFIEERKRIGFKKKASDHLLFEEDRKD